MSFDWTTYIDLAKTLNALPDESAQRSAVSRAYYSVFHTASNTLNAKGVQTFPRDQRKSHAKIWNVYKESSKRDCRRIGAKGGRLMNDRHDADYDAARNFNPAEVSTFITEVETLVTAIAAPANVPEGFIGPLAATAIAVRPGPLGRAWRAVKSAVGFN